MEAVSLWKTGNRRVRLIDSCHGALCNPSCPDELVFVDTAVDWGEVVNAVSLCVSLLSVAVCVVVKLRAAIHFLVRQREQRKYLSKMESFQGKEEVHDVHASLQGDGGGEGGEGGEEGKTVGEGGR